MKIVAMGLSGVLLPERAWKEASQSWFARMANELDDPSLREWPMREGYFQGVDLVMSQRMPEASLEKRREYAREEFFAEVLKRVSKRSNKHVVKYLQSLSQEYALALITTNTRLVVDTVLERLELENLFTYIVASEPDGPDNKLAVLEKFLALHQKPALYIGGSRETVREYCSQQGIRFLDKHSFEDEEQFILAIERQLRD